MSKPCRSCEQELARLRAIIDECLQEIACSTECTLHGDRSELIPMVLGLLDQAYPLPESRQPPPPTEESDMTLDENESAIHLDWPEGLGARDSILCETDMVRPKGVFPSQITIESGGVVVRYALDQASGAAAEAR